jgi:Asp-tRNA(Asn)/Glu-tRNA(Gln) amidotransferase A subunit family amidase
LESGTAVQSLRFGIPVSDLETECRNLLLAADGLSQCDHGMTDPLSLKQRKDVEFVQQAPASVELEAEAERQHEVAGEFVTDEDQHRTAQLRVAQQLGYRSRRDLRVKAHLLVEIKLFHELQEGRQVRFCQRADIWSLHVRIVSGGGRIFRNPEAPSYNVQPFQNHISGEPMLDRRAFLTVCSRFGVGATLLPGVLWALAEDKPKVTRDMIDCAATMADVHIDDQYKDMMLESLNDATKSYDAIYALHMKNDVAPAVIFDPVLPGMKFETERRPARISPAPAIAGGAPKNLEDVAFYSVRQLAELVRTRKVSSSALTDIYLARLKRYDPLLHFVITLTEDRARAQAKEADREIAAGKYRGPLHGLPWGAKDLLAVKGYRTTWGAGGFEDQKIDEDATVVQRLDQAGAVLVAKLTLGALALGDKWFGGMTRNPWNPQQGSSGSSAGSASATAAGCVAFAIGSETLGSISSPSTRCGTTGLRPSFGLVPRTGAMALSWTMDKLGPICRAVEDTALVLSAIYGPDGHDRTVKDAAFNWDASLDWRKLRVGYLEKEFQFPPPQEQQQPKEEKDLTEAEKKKREEEAAQQAAFRTRREYDHKYDVAALEKLRSMGVKLVPLELPKLPYQAMLSMLEAEAAAAFDDLTRSGRDKLLTGQKKEDWPNTFRTARFIPAVEYIQASRARTLAMEAFAKMFDDIDVIVAPTQSTQLLVTNLTGHPALILPNGFRGGDAPKPTVREGELQPGGPGTPVSLTFLGRLYGEAKMLALARAYQDATGFHLKHPDLNVAAG